MTITPGTPSVGTAATSAVRPVAPSPRTSGPRKPSPGALGATSRVWLALPAIGAGLIVIAVGAGSPIPLAAVLLLLGGSQAAWGLAVLGLERIPFPRLSLPLFLATTLLWGVVVGLTTVLHDSTAFASIGLFPMVCASGLSLAIALTLVVRIRNARAAAAGARAPRSSVDSGQRPGRFVLSLVIAALVVSGVTTPALAATTAGQFAVPHGEHGGTTITDGHSGH